MMILMKLIPTSKATKVWTIWTSNNSLAQKVFICYHSLHMEKSAKDNTNSLIDSLFAVGAHFGFAKSRRHPSASPFIFGQKNKVEIFDLEKTETELAKALAFVTELGKKRAPVLFVSGKFEAQAAIEKGALALSQPYVAGRWIGGTLTNFTEIKKRVAKMEDLMVQRERGELAKYTKKERLLIDRDIEKMYKMFSGLTSMKGLPAALFVVDPRAEDTAVREAQAIHIPVISLSGSDCNMKDSTYPIPANDSAKASIAFFVDKVVEAYKAGALMAE
jgi:small subunit ribosomal protein S2